MKSENQPRIFGTKLFNFQIAEFLNYQIVFFIFFLLFANCQLPTAFAGNADRVGQAGATELLINPWARSSGWNGLNVASIHGIEAMNVNIGGLAFTKKTEIIFARTTWLKGSEVFINTAGFAQKVGKTGVMGLSIMSEDFGDINITNTKIPDGGIGTYAPQFVNIGLSYSKEFSNSIYGGILFRGISEGIADVKSFGLAFDAGIQYVTGKTNNAKFGISAKNIGTPMRYGGDGLSFKSNDPAGKNNKLTADQRAERFELPSIFIVGGAYDFKIKQLHRLTVAASFTSNSFSKDQIGAGAEYAFREFFMIRAGYNYENTKSDEIRINALTGFSAGFSFELPVVKNGTTFCFDYSYRASNPFQGTHTWGLRINLL